MALNIEVVEPGADAVIVNVLDRVDKSGRVTIGRSLNKKYPHHIRLSKASNMVSGFQVTLEVRGNDSEPELWVRDGGARDGEWKPSGNGTRLNNVFMNAGEWYCLRVGDVLRIGRPGVIELSGFEIRYPTCETISDSPGNVETTSFGAIEVWRAESLINEQGTLLLRKLSSGDQLVIEKMDSSAEKILGGQPGELIALSGRLLLETFLNEREDLEIQVRLSRQQGSPVPGFYTGVASRLKLLLRCNEIDGKDWYLGYVSTVEAPEQSAASWKHEAIQSAFTFAGKYPLLFALGVAVAFGLALLVYVITK